MTFKIILSLLFGFSIGANVMESLDRKSRDVSKDLIATQEELIKTYEEYIKYVEEEHINLYKDAFYETLNEYIKLKKKLKAYE